MPVLSQGRGGTRIQCSMPKTARLTECTEWIDLDFMERERTPRSVIEKGIRYHLAGLSLSNTVTLLDDLGVNRSRVAVHNWVRKADLQPAAGESPDRLRSIRKRSGSTTSSTGCTLPSTRKRIESFTHGCFRRI